MLSGISLWQLLIVLVIIMLLFGTRKLRNIGGDLGGAVSSFKQALNSPDTGNSERQASEQKQNA